MTRVAVFFIMVIEEKRIQINPVCGLWLTTGFVRLTPAFKAFDKPSKVTQVLLSDNFYSKNRAMSRRCAHEQ